MTAPRALSDALQSTSRCWLGAGVVAVSVLLAACAASTPAYKQAQAVAGVQAHSEALRLAQTRLQLAALHLEHGRPEVALDEVALALQAHPHYVDAYNLKGWIYLSLQDYPSAHDSFTQALQLQPGDAEGLYNLGWLYCQQRNFAQADQNFDAALAAPRSGVPSIARTWLAKGVCLRQAGQINAAVQALEKAYQFDAGNPVVAYNFAHALHQQGNNESAQFYIRRVNNGQWASAASLWLGIKVERSLGDRMAMRQLADQLHKRFPDSKEWQRFERGAFDD